MNIQELLHIIARGESAGRLVYHLQNLSAPRIHISGMVGSGRSLLLASIIKKIGGNQWVICNDKESAAYFYNDLEGLLEEQNLSLSQKMVLFFPPSYKRAFEIEKQDNSNILLRTEVIKRLGAEERKSIIVTYPEGLAEKVIDKSFLLKNSFRVKRGEPSSVEFIADLLIDSNFERVDFVYEPGQFSIRGGILDVFSFTHEFPYRIEFSGKSVESVRNFNPSDQLTITLLDHATIVPNFQDRRIIEKRTPVTELLPDDTVIWTEDIPLIMGMLDAEFEKATGMNETAKDHPGIPSSEELFITADDFIHGLEGFALVETGDKTFFQRAEKIGFNMQPQPSFNKNFALLTENLRANTSGGKENLIFSNNPNQIKRLYAIFNDLAASSGRPLDFRYDTVQVALHEGFIDNDLNLACYTDHQIFERYHKFHLREKISGSQALTLKELNELQPGDYITHIDHGIGRFDGLEKVSNHGKEQEAIRIVYKDGDLLYISIHSLHRISKYTGKEGAVPTLSRLGSNTWNRLKEKTKKKVKDIAKDLIALYAKRKSSQGFAFMPDTYLQHELEASFIYEDTPDQVKSTQDVKNDMEAKWPMDRLVCGDVGFGKTEVAIRAAFKAVNDSKQVAVLVPTTILALQHYKTFSDRLEDFPCKTGYINRFKSSREQAEILKKTESGEIDILIGTHRLLGKDIRFRDLGLLIIDEEQKFGVAAKEKLKNLRVNVDTLTLTATPIPRTLQFSLMGARDLSVINTPPPNRYPIQTEVRPFAEDIIREAIHFEVERGGQVFFVHNRVQNIGDVAAMIARNCPDVRIAIGHGQMEGHKIENVMLNFINGLSDVLVTTTIIESGLDIPNVNTIIINDAQNFGLSDLHQLRGRVGRSNKRAFCYLLAPPSSTLTSEARKRLRAIEEFSALGSGFNIAMRDLDIRGAGNILGAEQSGFISEIGFEMYHKILDEAILELKESEFKHLYTEESEIRYVRDCQIETDLAILIPDDYITHIAERLSLYRELDNISEEVELQRFRLRMIDRFGPLPPQTEELIETIRLRWLAREIGFEKITMKNSKLTGYFISSQESPFYQSSKFSRVIEFLKNNPHESVMNEKKGRLMLQFHGVDTVNAAIGKLKMISGDFYQD
ncbi:MAG: transcription-repair coupling factor [Bacteroidales bacterium]|nr:transcription-repair coupling factor [Bacteroidales bacterium]